MRDERCDVSHILVDEEFIVEAIDKEFYLVDKESFVHN